MLAKSFNRKTAIDSAVYKNRNFHWASQDTDVDIVELIEAGSIKELAINRIKNKSSMSFNRERVIQYLSNDVDYDRLLSIADGVRIDKPDNFINGKMPEKFRALQTILKNTYSFLYTRLRRKNKGIILPINKLTEEFLNNLHFKDSHWTPKEIDGRILVDDTNGILGSILNTQEVKLKGIDRYGKCNLPQMNDIFNQWVEYCISNNTRLSECSLWKEDIDGGFPQLFIDPEDVNLMATKIDEDYIFVYLHCSMGYTNIPMAFCCLSNAVNRAVLNSIKGVCKVYVDDFIGLAKDDVVIEDHNMAKTVIRNCINDHCLNETKRVDPVKVGEVLGWSINLIEETFCPSEKSRNKLLISFFFVDYNKSLSCKVYQLLASLAERYSSGLIALSCFVHPFHTMTSIGKHKRKPSASIIFCIDMWRIIGIILYADSSFFNKKIISITGHCYLNGIYIYDSIMVITDASPWKVGAAIMCRLTSKFICYTSMELPFKDDIKDYQNIREYLGKFTGLILTSIFQKNKVIKTTNIEWVNDNTAAVKWAEKDKCCSSYGHFANIIMSWFQIYSSYNVTQVQRIPGKDMGFIDDISRDVYHPLMDTVPYINIKTDITVQLFELCNPFNKRVKKNNMDAFFEVHSLLSKL